MKRFVLLFSVLAFSTLLPCTATADFKRTKVAVLDFQLKGKGYDTPDMGKIVSEWLITSLVKDGRFEVVDRGLLKKNLWRKESWHDRIHGQVLCRKIWGVTRGKGYNFGVCNEISGFYSGQCQDHRCRKRFDNNC